MEDKPIIEVVMADEKYASIKQLIELAKDGKFAEMEYLFKNYTYSRYAIANCSRQLLLGKYTKAVYDAVIDYCDSAKETL